MKRVVSVSLGSSIRDHHVTLQLMGEEISIERVGVNGDVERAIQLYRELDGTVDALGVGGIDLYLIVKGKPYALRQALKLVADVKQTPAVDGGTVRSILERRIMQVVDAELGGQIPLKRALITSAIDRYDMAQSFQEAGYETIYGDFMWALGLPVPIRGIRNLERIAALLMPVLGGLPLDMIYPTGEKQREIVPKWGKYYAWAAVIAGDFNYIKRHLPDRLDGKIIVTNTTTQDDVDLLRERGASYLATTTPRFAGRTFGTNVLEATLIALSGKGRVLTRDEVATLLEQFDFRPTITRLNPLAVGDTTVAGG
jgi:hypothetical protein